MQLKKLILARKTISTHSREAIDAPLAYKMMKFLKASDTGGAAGVILGAAFYGAVTGAVSGVVVNRVVGGISSAIDGVKIVGTAQKTGSIFHRFASNVQAGKMSMALGRYSEIHLNRSKGLGIKGFRPDVIGITKNGLRVVEVVSSTQTYASQAAKVVTMMGRYSHITNGLVLDGLHLLLRWFVD